MSESKLSTILNCQACACDYEEYNTGMQETCYLCMECLVINRNITMQCLSDSYILKYDKRKTKIQMKIIYEKSTYNSEGMFIKKELESKYYPVLNFITGKDIEVDGTVIPRNKGSITAYYELYTPQFDGEVSSTYIRYKLKTAKLVQAEPLFLL